MKITLIKSNIGRREIFIPFDVMEPLALAILASLTPPDVKVVCHDERFEDIPYDEPTDLVGITVAVATAKRSYEIADEFRRRGVPVVLGGPHPSLTVDEALQHADAVVVGEAEEIWPQVVLDARGGQLKRVYRAASRPSLEGLRPDRSIYRDNKYYCHLIEFGRGCKWRCNFCYASSYYRQTYTHRPVGDVIEEVKGLGRDKMFFFTDINIAVEPQTTKRFLRELAPLGIQWIGYATADIVLDEEMLALMQSSGCYCLVIGFESLEMENIAQMEKAPNLTVPDYRKVARRLRAHGISPYGCFMFGYDHDTESTFQRSLEFAIANKFYMAGFIPLCPFKDTPVYEKMRSEHRLTDESWWTIHGERMTTVFNRHPRFTPEEIDQKIADMQKIFYGWPSIIRRIDLRTNCKHPLGLISYLYSNVSKRRELSRRLEAHII